MHSLTDKKYGMNRSGIPFPTGIRMRADVAEV